LVSQLYEDRTNLNWELSTGNQSWYGWLVACKQVIWFIRRGIFRFYKVHQYNPMIIYLYFKYGDVIIIIINNNIIYEILSVLGYYAASADSALSNFRSNLCIIWR